MLVGLTQLPKDPSGRSEKGKAGESKRVWACVCVYAGEREGEGKRTRTSHHTQMLALLYVGAQSQSLYKTIYSNQAVTFSSIPAGTSSTLGI